MTTSEDINKPGRSNALAGRARISRARAVSATRTSSDGASTTTVPWASSEM
ncbi:hypothetical protein ACVWW4_003992 [Bradyrhizobium sp. LB7.1]